MAVFVETSPQISEALGVLENAATHAKQELKTLITDKYANLRSTIIENEQALVKTLSEAKDSAVDHTREVAHDVAKHVRKEPWLYLGAMAAVGLLLGYLVGHRRD